MVEVSAICVCAVAGRTRCGEHGVITPELRDAARRGQLFPTPPEPPHLTGRQQAVHDALRRAGHEGMGAGEAGAAAHAYTGRHSQGRICGQCVDAGNEVLRALRKKGLARYTLRAGWLATDAPVAKRPPGMTERIPY